MDTANLTETFPSFALGLLVALVGTATAARLITGKQIQDGSIGSKDLSKALRKQLAKAAKPGAPGPSGAKGDQGVPGAKGEVGPQGPGARGFVTTVAKGAGGVTLTATDNGLTVTGFCGQSVVSAGVETTSGASTFEGSGIVAKGPPTVDVAPVEATSENPTTGTGFPQALSGHVDLIARDRVLGRPLAHVVVGGQFDSATGCRFWGTVTPTS